MTNNPTIDGVSRELLKSLWRGAVTMGWGSAQQLQDLLEAPAVERQEPVARCLQSPVRKYLSVELLRTHMKDGDLLYSAPPEVAALESTIAQLQARVQELESGSEPIFQVQYRGEGGGGWSDAEKESYDAKVPHPKHWKTRIVYATPPVPVAVLLPERQPVAATCVTRDRREGWNACLDATAALNGERK